MISKEKTHLSYHLKFLLEMDSKQSLSCREEEGGHELGAERAPR